MTVTYRSEHECRGRPVRGHLLRVPDEPDLDLRRIELEDRLSMAREDLRRAESRLMVARTYENPTAIVEEKDNVESAEHSIGVLENDIGAITYEIEMKRKPAKTHRVTGAERAKKARSQAEFELATARYNEELGL